MKQLLKLAPCCLLIAFFLPGITLGQGRILERVTETDFFGSVKDGIYRNTFFKFELKVPKDWMSLNDAEKEAALNVGVDALKTKNAKNNKALEEAARAEIIILLYAKKPLGTMENSVLAIGAAKQPSAKITPQMVVEAAKSLFLKNPKNRLIQDTKAEMIGGKNFASMVIDLDLNGTVLRLKYFATMIREYSMTASMSYDYSEELSEAEKSLRSIKFVSK
jgi:hypothetical protein